jgi:hypothetical protein
VRVDWSKVTHDWWGDPVDVSTFVYASVTAWDPPIDTDLVIRALCAGAPIEEPDEPPTYFRDLERPSVTLGVELPRITSSDRLGFFSAGGAGYVVALLLPDAESTNDVVVIDD